MNVFVFAGMVLALIVFAGVGHDIGSAQSSSPVVVVDNGASASSLAGIARFFRHAELTFGVSGRIAELLVEEGQEVSRGDRLAILYSEAAEATVAEANIRASAVGSLEVAKAELAATVSKFSAMQRANKKQRNSFSAQAIADVEAAVRRGRALVQQQKEESMMAVAGAKTAQSQLDALILRAPFTGVIVRRHKSVGEGVDPVSPVYELTNDSRMRIEFFVPEEQADRYVVGSPVRVVAGSGSAHGSPTIVAKVKFVDISIQPVRRVIRAWTEIERPDWMRDGMAIFVESLSPES